MLQDANFKNTDDKAGNPAGGHYNSTGIKINGQNGAFGDVENVIEAMRISYYQDSKFACFENEQALRHLQLAAAWLDKRTKDREARQVEGTHAK